MKTNHTIISRAALLAAFAITGVAIAQEEAPGRPPHPPMPVMETLDKDEDGTLSAEEIEAAPVSLRMLDIDGDGTLSPEELRPARPEPPAGEEDTGEEEPPAKPKHDGPRGHRPPAPPVIAVLDEDRDGAISAEEIEASAESLLKLDRDDSGDLSPEELHPPKPERGQGGGGRRGPRGHGGPDEGERGGRGPRR